MSRRVLIVVAAAAAVAALAAYTLRPPTGVPEGAPTEDEMAAAVGAQIMEHVKRGHVPGRSAEVMTVPKPHNYLIGEWDLTALGSDAPITTSSHPNPWDYTARVPIFFYGPGRVPHGLDVTDEVDSADIAPTYAALLGMDDFEADGSELEDIVDASLGRKPPKAIVTVVLDGGGWNALQEHPDDWPTIALLGRRGTTYTNATIGSAPSITGAIHATIGTGLYPMDHGIPGNQLRAPDGTNQDAYQDDADPSYLEAPAVSELWDERNDNEPWVGTVSYEGWHLGMIGHGAQRPGGDKDVAVLWDAEDNEWWVNEDFYKLPSYLKTTDLDRLESYEAGLDRRDGLDDGTWFGHTLDELQEFTVRPGTPAYVRFTGDAVMDVLRNEDIGSDELTDLFWVEMKMPDYAGHAWNVLRPEEGDVLFETDRQIARMKQWLDEEVGAGDYILAVTADHGQQPLPELFGGWRINSEELERDIEERFGAGVVEKVTTVDVYVNEDRVEEAGVDLDDIARYIGTYTLGDNIFENQPGSDHVPEARLDDRLFAGAFSTNYIQDLTSEAIESFGDGDYPEGDLGLRGSGRPGG
ncbi:MAG: alkaline phosphatase family protein [Actinomycetota bacterium]